jgi:biotin transport system substrate-specific component
MHSTLVFELWPNTRDSLIAKTLLAIAGSVLLAISAKVQVPFWPVPMTMQTFAVLVLGMTFGFKLASATGARYLLEGALGLPVFAKGAGLAYLMGPTGGYLVGFLVAMAVMGLLASRGWDRAALTTLAAMLIGDALIFLFGVGWLATVVGGAKALTLGLTPFIAAEIFKIILAVITLPLVWRLIRR